jgi:hypothetical protein
VLTSLGKYVCEMLTPEHKCWKLGGVSTFAQGIKKGSEGVHCAAWMLKVRASDAECQSLLANPRCRAMQQLASDAMQQHPI